MFETLCSHLRAANSRWLEMSSRLHMWFFSSIPSSVVLCSSKENTFGVHTPTYTYERFINDICSHCSVILSLSHTHTHTREYGLLSVVFLCDGNHHPQGVMITERTLVPRGSAKLEPRYTPASSGAHCVKTAC